MVKCSPLWAVGRQGAQVPTGGAGGMAGPIFHLLSVPWHTVPLAWGQRDQNIQTDRGEKKVKMIVSVAESCLTLCDIMDCSLPGSSVHGVLQARILEWVAIPFSREG